MFSPRKPLTRTTPLKRRESQTKGRSAAQLADWDFYEEIWIQRGGICDVTGAALGPEPLTTMFHHILPKARYPEFRYAAWNILLIHPEIHHQIELDIDKVPVAKKKYEELVAIYGLRRRAT